MKKRKTFVAAALATAGIGSPTAVMARENIPVLQASTVASVVAFCKHKAGHLTQKASFKWVDEILLEMGYEKREIYYAAFHPDAGQLGAQYLKRMGGCRNVLSRFEGNVNTSLTRTNIQRGSLSDTPFEF